MKKAEAIKSAKRLIKRMKHGRWDFHVWNPYRSSGNTWDYMIQNEFCSVSHNSYHKNYLINAKDYLENKSGVDIICNNPNVGYEKVIRRVKKLIRKLNHELDIQNKGK